MLALLDDPDRPQLTPTEPPEADEIDDWTRHEVACALRISDGTAELRLRVARALQLRLPGTRAALAEGRIGYWHAAAIVEGTTELNAALLPGIEERVLARAERQSVAEVRRAVRRAALAADPTAAQVRHERAIADRRVEHYSLPDGMAELRAVLGAADAQIVLAGLTAMATRPRAAGDDRGIDARRADALVEVFTGVLAGEAIASGPTPRAAIHVAVGATTLLGLDDEPAELAGYGPIPAELARQLATDGTWRRLLTEPQTGKLLDYGRNAYTPPADLQRFIAARDGVCRFPHCQQPASRCDIDHAVPWDQGGETNPANCSLLCRRHHRAKTLGGWRLKRNEDASCSWTSPAGKSYRVDPHRYGTDP